MLLNPIDAWRAWRWRKRVEWFAQAAAKARFQRGSPWNMRNWPKPELIRKQVRGTVWVRDYCPDDDKPERRPYDEGGWIPGPSTKVVLDPDECILSPARGWRCARSDHNHDEDN